MTRARRNVLFAVIVVGHLLAALGALAQLLSPGELARAHKTLEGDDRCTDCHARGRRVDTDACTRCHTDIGGQRRSHQGLHGGKFRGDDCGHCHVEHRGANYDLIRWPGGSQKGFDHSMTGFELEGAHGKTACAKCHDGKNARGAVTFLGARRACASCHEDPHEKRFGDKCQSCHDASDFKNVRLERFDHDLARFKLRGAHQKQKCAACHEDPPRYEGIEFASCKSCHEDPHKNRFGDKCESCHNETDFKTVVMKRSAHPGLSLAGGHKKTSCNACHDVGADVAPRAGNRCVDCHKPVHEAAFGRDCQRCHRRIEWLGLPEKLGRSVHDKTAFALVGQHQEVDCNKCHDPGLPRAARYRQLTFERCMDCHEDAHAGEFAGRDAGECAPCHSEDGFSPTRFGLLAHAETGFVIDGGHAAVPCGRCHGDAHPRLDLRVTKTACADCHQNPHGDQFASEMRDGGCAHCHATSAWNRPRVDHDRWPLTGAHAAAACAACHAASAADQKAGAGASYRGVPRECEGCHEDVHLGQFRLQEPRHRCDHCHQTERFALDAFDHARLANYPLRDKHAKVACESCHQNAELANGSQAVRYRLGYRDCGDCHADPHREASR